MVPMSFRMSCLLVEMPADAVVLASWINEIKTRMISISLIGSIVAVLGEPNIFIVFQGCSLSRLDFFGGVSLSK